ncbi:hypothetical protein G3N55_12515, partial [Dissulfurirhabdus thermomarina]
PGVRAAPAPPPDPARDFNRRIHELAAELLQNLDHGANPENPIVVATFVDLNRLYRTTPFGRYVAEQLMGELQRAGFRVLEVRKTASIIVSEDHGEYGLSRDVREIARKASARHVLVGTYVARGGHILLNARLVSNDDSVVVSSAAAALQRDTFLDRMLWPASDPKEQPPVSMPVKGYGESPSVRILTGP